MKTWWQLDWSPWTWGF